MLLSCTQVEVTPDNFSLDDKIPSDKSLLVVYRINSFYGSGAIYNLKIDDKSIGVLTIGQYKKIFIDPGSHKFSAFREIKINLEQELIPGKVYFLEESHAFGNQDTRPKLTFVSKERALSKLSKCYDVNYPDKIVETQQINQAKNALEKMTLEQKNFATKTLTHFTTETTFEDISKVLGEPYRGTANSPQWHGPGGGINDVVEADFIDGTLFQICYRQMFPFFKWKILYQDGELKPILQ